MPVNAEDVAVALRAAGIDAEVADHNGVKLVTLNPGDASTFLDLLTGGGQQGEHHDIIRRFAHTCPHDDGDEHEDGNEHGNLAWCRWCGWTGEEDDWPDAYEEHNINCLWATANRWTRRYP